MIPNRPIDVIPASGGVGAEIDGARLDETLSDDACRVIRQALDDYGVIFFRDQTLTPELHIAFANRFGTIHKSKFLGHVPGYPEIAEVAKEEDQTQNVGGFWHTDQSYDEVPSMGSILLAREVPRRGGDTLFANMMAAYESLSDGLKETLKGLNAVHNAASNQNLRGYASYGDQAVREVVHPVVIRHPSSGRPALFVNPCYTTRFVGWTEAESAPLLRYLCDHATKPENTHRFQWREGSIAFWDNRATLHYALNDYHGARRIMHRVTLKGSPLAPAQ